MGSFFFARSANVCGDNPLRGGLRREPQTAWIGNGLSAGLPPAKNPKQSMHSAAPGQSRPRMPSVPKAFMCGGEAVTQKKAPPGSGGAFFVRRLLRGLGAGFQALLIGGATGTFGALAQLLTHDAVLSVRGW